MSIVVAVSPKSNGQSSFSNDALGSDVGKGAGGGALAGGLYGLSCGPLLILCVPLGAAMGAIVGSAGGAAVSVDGTLSREQADQLVARLLRLNETRSQLAALESNITDRAGKYWDLNSEHPSYLVNVEVQDLILGSTHSDQVRSILRVQVTVQNNGEQPAQKASKKTPKKTLKPKLYESVGPYASLAVWLDEDSDFAETSLNSSIQQISTQIVSDLAVK
ncbi:MAG: hypothetical protein MUP90_05260 [Gammaproteobacteria bacterium]|nr:hypothetical protein [Gammaproteobacteria bacterium]